MDFTNYFKEVCDQAIADAVGDTVTYIGNGTAPKLIQAYFDKDFLSDFDISGHSVFVACLQSDIPHASKLDKITYSNQTYNITDISENEPDTGFVTLKLEI